MKKVPHLNRGSTIAVLSPSWSGPAVYPLVYDLGIKTLKKYGFNIVEYPTTRNSPDYNSVHPEERARDLINAFNDKKIDGIICSIGGNDCVKLLKYLDQHELPPKFFMGYSDSTVLLNYFNKRGFVSFHGPSVMAGFAQLNYIDNEFDNHVLDFLINDWSSYVYHPYKVWTEKILDWSNPESTIETVIYNKNKGWKFYGLTENKEIKGLLWGGCLEALEFIKNTEYWPKDNVFWKDKVLMLEISDEGITEENIHSILVDYGNKGILNNIKALLIGRFSNITDKKRDDLEELVLNVVRNEFSSKIPIITNMDFGHTYPQQIFPIGEMATIKLVDKNVSINIDSPFH